VNDTVWLDTSQGINQRPQQRSVGYIFQDAALFPNLTVRENILFVTPRGQQALADQLIDATGLGPFINQKPTVLSGGQQQRVALARALVRQPKLLLLDEPFAGLDTEAAQTLRHLLLDLHQTWGTTTLLVTHDNTDVQALANRIIRLKQGRVQSDEAFSSQPELPHVNEPIRKVWFDESQQQWVIETDTIQVRSANPEWSKLQPGSPIELSWKQ
jgi:molybdate transport system ATP-binding protein